MTQPMGWFPDPEDPSRQRWWDGAQWTSQTRHTPTATPASVPPPKKSGKKVLAVVGVLVGAFVLLGIVGALLGDPGTDTDSASSTSAAPTTMSDAELRQLHKEEERSRVEASKTAASKAAAASAAAAARVDRATYQATDSRGWQLIAKNPDSHVGEKYVIYGRVTQADSALGSSTIRVNTDGAQVDYYEMDINTIATAGAASFSEVVEDDLVTMYVVVKGSQTYDTQIGGSTTAPEVEVNVIDVTGSTK